MATEELVLSRLEQRFESVSARPILRIAGTLLARAAITVVLAVLGSALMLIALTVLDRSPLLVVAAITISSWRASARLLADLQTS